VYISLNKLVEANIVLYYSGDFDPEGIQIADKLKQRYKENIILWHYDEGSYKTCISKKKISERRLSMLDKINNHDLAHISFFIKQEKRSNYQ